MAIFMPLDSLPGKNKHSKYHRHTRKVFLYARLCSRSIHPTRRRGKNMEPTTMIDRYIAAVPKSELHVHLEGAIQPATLLTLAQRNSVPLPVQTVVEMQRWFTFRDFNHFVEIFFTISRCLKTAEDYELIAYEFGATMARQHVRYAEVTFSPSTHHFSLGVPFDTFFAGLTLGRKRAESEFGI